MEDFNLKSVLNCERNIEDIRRKNLEDNQLFLEQLRMTDIQKDFLNSARSILHEKENIKKPIEYKKISYKTRFSLKVKSGEIPSHIPEWQREKQEKLLEKEQLIEKQKRKLLAKEQLIEKQKRKLLLKEQKRDQLLEEQKRKLLAKEQRIEEQKRNLLLKEQKRKLREKRLKRKKPRHYSNYNTPKWMSSYPISANSYHRAFEPRHTTRSERIEQQLQESLKQDDS